MQTYAAAQRFPAAEIVTGTFTEKRVLLVGAKPVKKPVGSLEAGPPRKKKSRTRETNSYIEEA